MSDNIKQEPASSSVENESQETVPNEEYNKLKRKLEKVEAELKVEKKKMKSLLATADIKFRPKRARISLILPNFDELSAQNFPILSEPVEVAGFQWKLRAFQFQKWMYFSLDHCPPAHYKGRFEFELDCSFRLYSTFTSKDIQKEVNGCKIVRNCLGTGIGSAEKYAKIEDLLNPANGFVQADGSVQMEVDFTVKTATLDHLLAENV